MLISMFTYAEVNWDYKQDVIYQENHDPSMVWLIDGRKIEVIYDQIPWEEVDRWKKGKQIVIAYKIGEGNYLVDPITGKRIPILSGIGIHPIEQIQAQCLEKNLSTKGSVDCYDAANKMWDKEMNVSYNKLMSQLDKAGKESLKQSQRSWIKFRDAQADSILKIYNRDGTMWNIVEAQKVMEITREQALRLNGLISP